jgi:hypothetical protein
MSTCEKVGAFVDGELPDAEHREFQDHLASCTSCPDEMLELWDLDAAARRVMDRERGQVGLVAGILLVGFALSVAGMFLAWGLA